MQHSHDHTSDRSDLRPGHGADSVSGLRIAFCVTSAVLVIEAVGGLLTGSLALLADAGHMLTDAGALGIALLAAWVAARPRSRSKSFGYGRAEILAALANGLLLGAVSVTIAIESVSRLREGQHEVDAGPMLVIAVVGLLANGISAWFLMRTGGHNLNVRAALLHVLGDALGSVAAIGAACAILFFGLFVFDAIAGLAIAGLLVVNAVRLIAEASHILLEGTPKGVSLDDIARRVCEIPGVRAIHDLHIWTVTSGFPAMSAHVDLEKGANAEEVRRSIHQLLHQVYNIEHTTIQTEAWREPELLAIEPSPPPAG
ncbi:MAG: cation transporter [Deltaproteobacteria bacterium]|nr:cation transporter [Deltaproteobacteria bacterium]MBW2419753.1 cation transporter [Deltaproteobacteria bacterium]